MSRVSAAIALLAAVLLSGCGSFAPSQPISPIPSGSGACGLSSASVVSYSRARGELRISGSESRSVTFDRLDDRGGLSAFFGSCRSFGKAELVDVSGDWSVEVMATQDDSATAPDPVLTIVRLDGPALHSEGSGCTADISELSAKAFAGRVQCGHMVWVAEGHSLADPGVTPDPGHGPFEVDLTFDLRS